MMGLLGNVAEVALLRPQLMNKLFLSVFYELLDSCSDGIEVRTDLFIYYLIIYVVLRYNSYCARDQEY